MFDYLKTTYLGLVTKVLDKEHIFISMSTYIDDVINCWFPHIVTYLTKNDKKKHYQKYSIIAQGGVMVTLQFIIVMRDIHLFI